MTNISKAISSLSEGQFIKITPQGFSMCPTFYGGRDQVLVGKPSFPLKKGDVAVFLRDDGTYVIHRICRVKKKSDSFSYFFVGDNQTAIEGPIRTDQIHGITLYIEKKGKQIDCRKSISYRIYSSLWLFLRPVRPLIMKIYNLLSCN